ncbi:MAG: hypothetical protein B6U68_01965 [Candidatus Aenigmarchaeota archaeon ex4484_14]|nr:hypothetical protein [Candidatus Aenigmarchaeota archaeon]OYT57351.1 MAG: hypothetical protein B6U68_01965 [Candidatus Aenigmarchaeota archaeon ex4484_14]
MCFKELLRPEWKKFILPIIFVILFLFTVSTFYSVASVMDKYVCDIASLFQQQEDSFKQKDMTALNQTVEKMDSLREEMTNELKNIDKLEEPISLSLRAIISIDPFFPTSCSYVTTDFCKFYISEKTYNCSRDIASKSFRLLPIELKLKEYQRVSLAILGLHGLILFLEGYLISAVVLFSYRKLRKK